MNRRIPIRLAGVVWVLVSAVACPRPPGDAVAPAPISADAAAAASDGGPPRDDSPPAVGASCCSDIVVEEPLEEAALLAVRAGDAIADPEAAAWGDSWVREGEIAHANVDGRHILLVPLIWAGNGAAVAILREAPEGLCVVNAWAFAFGGNGIDIVSIELEPEVAGLRVLVSLVGHHRGWYADPDDEASYVEPADAPMDVVLGTDGSRAWVIQGVTATPWHEPVGERAPATDAAQKVVEEVRKIEGSLTATRYQHRTAVNERRGTYYWDCAGMAEWVLDRAAPWAREALSDDRPLARDFYDRIAESPTDEPRRGWLRLPGPEDIAPGDVFAWRKPDFWRERPNTGHVGFVVGTPQPHPDLASVWLVPIADATEYLHESDSRPDDGEGGFGPGTMAFQFDESGTPVAYGWYGSLQDPATYVPTKIAFGRVSR
ncbi:MAG: hypothetical protein HY905_12890 [Deltaproteobacteria bacterium]|nr:hypothetical protein [Deltaproteobacteria bacterium]